MVSGSLSRTDTQAELEVVQSEARDAGAFDAIICNHWAKGGAGATDLAVAVEKATNMPSNFSFLYDLQVKHMTAMAGGKWMIMPKLLFAFNLMHYSIVYVSYSEACI